MTDDDNVTREGADEVEAAALALDEIVDRYEQIKDSQPLAYGEAVKRYGDLREQRGREQALEGHNGCVKALHDTAEAALARAEQAEARSTQSRLCEHCGTALPAPRFCSDIGFCRARRREADTPLPEGAR